MKLFAHVAARLLLLLSAASVALAQRTIHIPADQPTIQAGIDAAGTGDTVLVAPGTYYENIDFKGKAITVTSSAGPAMTILDGSRGQTAAVAFVTNETRSSALNGLTIQGGGSEGYQVVASRSPGIYLSGAQPSIIGNVITHNHCSGIFAQSSSPAIINNEIDNTLDQNGRCTYSGGSAIVFEGSYLAQRGYTSLVDPGVLIESNVIQNNIDGGKDDGPSGGSALNISTGPIMIRNNILRNNYTRAEATVFSYNEYNTSIIGNLIYDNVAGQSSAGISLLAGSSATGAFNFIIENNTIYNNTLIHPLQVVREPASQVRLEGSLARFILINNVVLGNDTAIAAVSCGETYNYLSITPLVFDHNDIYNPGGPAYGGACPDQTGTYGNISADSLFINPVAGDFHLRAGSPAIDTGITAHRCCSPQTSQVRIASRMQQALATPLST